MQKISKPRRDWTIIGLTALFITVLLGGLLWGIHFLAGNLGTAINGKGSSDQALEFKVNDAKKILRARGFAD